jgi:all-trans-retinol 13,14-reductase
VGYLQTELQKIHGLEALNGEDMKDNLDVVIIGAGISGLMAGALLAKKGKRVLILESNVKIGGYLSAFTRKGYYFDVGMTRSNLSYVEPYLREAGVLDDLHFAKIDADYHVKGHYLPNNSLRTFFYAVSDIFPEEKDGITSFYDKEVAPREKRMKTIMYSDFKSMGTLRKYLTIIRILSMIPGMLLEGISRKKENDLLRKYVDEQGEAYAFLCTRPDQINYRGNMKPSFYVGRLLSQFYNYYPREGYLHLCNLLKQVIVNNGSEVMTNSRVTRVEIENNVARGVQYFRKGQTQTVNARFVISAIDINKAFHKLIGADIVPQPEMKRLEASLLGSSIPILFLGLKITREQMRELFNGKEELNYYPEVKRLNAEPDDADFFRYCCMTLHSSSILNVEQAPPGCCNLQLYLACPPEGWQRDWELQNGQRTAQYLDLKKKVVEDLLCSLEKLIPELKDRSVIDVCELGTPHTNERYTGNTHGTALGFRYDRYFLSTRRVGRYYDSLSNVANMYFIGQQTGYGGGLNAALGSAKRVAAALKR